MFASCVAISNPDSLSSSEKGVSPGNQNFLKCCFGMSLSEAAAIHDWEHAMPKYPEYLFWQALSPKYVKFFKEFRFAKMFAEMTPTFPWTFPSNRKRA
jgi:hypothetical protein